MSTTTVKFCEAEGPYACFSNWFVRNFTIDGKEWTTTEAYFQAQKFTEEEYQETIRKASGPGEAKKLGYAKRPDFRKDWESVKDGIMKKALHAKFSQHKDLLTILLSTKDAQIVEDNPDDSYWGIGDGTGKNILGKLLMEVRSELSASQ